MSKQTLDEWDHRISPKLQDLEYCSGKIAFHTRCIQSAAATLPMRPAWQTKARESLSEAEKELRIALAVVQAARRRYDDAPIMIETYAKDTA